MFNKYTVILLASMLLSSCGNQGLYYWGSYENVVRQSYVDPGSVDVQTQIEELNADLQQAESDGKKVAPGVYAHLGMLYAEQGEYTQSKAALLQEKALFPESSVLIDGMLNRADKNLN